MNRKRNCVSDARQVNTRVKRHLRACLDKWKLCASFLWQARIELGIG
jgi:hypothetical protein